MQTLRIAAPFLALTLAAGIAVRPLHAAAPAVPHAQDYDHDHDGQWQGPPSYGDLGRRGWHDGMMAAQNDWQMHRSMDPYHNAMFRRPPTPYGGRQEYRNGFLRGYDMQMHQARGWGYRDNNGWHDEHDNWRENHEQWDNQPH